MTFLSFLDPFTWFGGGDSQDDGGFSWLSPSTWFIGPNIEETLFLFISIIIFLYAMYKPAKAIKQIQGQVLDKGTQFLTAAGKFVPMVL